MKLNEFAENEHNPFLYKREENKTKVVINDFKQMYLNKLSSWYDLSKPESKTVQAMFALLNRQFKAVEMPINKWREVTGIQRIATYRKVIVALIEKKLIARSKRRNVYYYNPIIFEPTNPIKFTETLVIENENA